jgi:AcrR family transcriptional regulator
MATTTTEFGIRPVSRRELQKEQTRLDLAVAALQMAVAHGLAAVRVPQIAASVGVSTRTFNNYFSSKEQAIVWPAGQHAAGVAANMRRATDGPLAEVVVDAVVAQYRPAAEDGLPKHWLRDFREMVTREPALYAEYLVATSAAEGDLANAIAERLPNDSELKAMVWAGMITAAERAAVLHWTRTRSRPLAELVRSAVQQAVIGLEAAP